MIVYANYTSSLTVNCEYGRACNDMKIYAQDAGSVTLECQADYACDSLELHADRATSVTLNAEGNYAFSGTLKASQVGSVSIRCASPDYNSACYKADWYLPDYGANTVISCYGEGCSYFGDIYVHSSV
eukprot:CAMPEP_0197032030 /NCGR_PEP_ID=MMETSP1384-20130603/10810_1 /TAXON_ID=29189 /ORGANISM="Ammonia sp." /LENGTH=127 /DNA_ID=CAMNT_0042461625 /DNA_START=52 /DNA_END=432 /DNA_ORIENTATION=+